MTPDPAALYNAYASRDPRFDGVFFIGVTSTGIYCRPVCTARTPKAANCRFFDSAETAEKANFRPCLRCRPELAPGNAPVDDAHRIPQLIAQRIEEGMLDDGAGLETIAKQFGWSSRQIRRVVQRELGVSPIELAQTRRLLLAKQLLTETSLPVTEIAFALRNAELIERVEGQNGRLRDLDAAKDEFPIERTYTEWSLSSFAAAPIDMGGRFGGNTQFVSTCQDCHMPTTTGTACRPSLGGATRTNLPQHDFNGANSWVPRAIHELDQTLALYPQSAVNGQPLAVFEAVIARNKSMLRAASDLALSKVGGDLVVRITNQSGHKLPTGYGEGRRMWINVKFYGPHDVLVAERGHYDFASADLTTSDTKVYEIQHGLDANMAALTGHAEAASFHLALNNKLYKDNRIPPRGFTNAAFEAGQAQPVGASYADGQYWDDTSFAIPAGASYATVSVYHQTTSKEYIDFLHTENVTDSKGDIAYDQWVAAGRSRPVLMDRRTLAFASPHVLPH